MKGNLSKQIFSEANIYTVIALVYYLRDDLLPAGHIIKWISYGGFFALSIYYFFQVVTKERMNPFLKSLSFIVLLASIYGGLFFITGSDMGWLRRADPLQFITSFFDSLLPIYAFFYFTRRNMIDENWFKVMAFVFFACAIFTYFSRRLNLQIEYGDEEKTNNTAYGIVSLIPVLVFFRKRPIIQFVGLSIIAILVLSGFKRGAILIAGLSLIVFFWRAYKQQTSIRRWWVFVLIVAVSVVAVKYVGNLLENSSYFNERLERTLDGQASGREDIYINYLKFFFDNSNILQYIFGYGAYGTCHYLGLMAHNDWIELLIDMGFIGFFAYLAYWIRYYKMYRLSRKYEMQHISDIILLFGMIYLLKSLFSMSILAFPFYATTVLGYAIAKFDEVQYYGTYDN